LEIQNTLYKFLGEVGPNVWSEYVEKPLVLIVVKVVLRFVVSSLILYWNLCIKWVPFPTNRRASLIKTKGFKDSLWCLVSSLIYKRKREILHWKSELTKHQRVSFTIYTYNNNNQINWNNHKKKKSSFLLFV
jgi:hypothetical protein